MDFYRKIFSRFEQLPRPPLKIRLFSLDKPEDLDAEGVAYDQLSVAYGLSLYPNNIVKIIESQTIEDLEKEPSKSYRDKYLGKEQS